MDRIALAALAALSLFGGIAAAVEFHPRPAEATLKDTERTYPRVSVEKDWFPTHSFGNRRYRVDANTVTEVTVPDKSKQRQASVPADYRLRWLGAAEGIAFFVADHDVARFDPDDPKSNRMFHRLELDSMKWLDPFKLPEPSIKPTQQQGIFLAQHAKDGTRKLVLADHLLVTPKGIVVFSTESVLYRNVYSPDFLQSELIGYHVSCYAAQDTEAKWDGIIRCGNQASRSVGFAMSSYDDSIERLTYVSGSHDDDLILVCPGEREAVVCLTAADGKVRWRIPAIWEYERGFIGPSVYEHYIGRFGLDYMTVQTAKNPVLNGNEEIDRKELRERIQSKMQARRKLTAASKAFYARSQGRITAGPIVAQNDDHLGSPRIYVAATRSLKPEPGGVEQPEHAFVYEIEAHSDRAEITGMTRLPRAVIGRPSRKVPGGFVLSCNQGCMVRLRTYEPVFGGVIGPGRAADDLVLQVDWYREYLMRSPTAWFIAAPPTDVAGFSKARLFRPSSAYIRNKEDEIYELQINVVDLRTGLDRDMTLSVPFKGSLPFPETGISSFNQGTLTEHFYAHGPHVVWIDRLTVDGDRLKVVVTHGSAPTELTFDVSAMLADE
jgi:hypothetical protein